MVPRGGLRGGVRNIGQGSLVTSPTVTFSTFTLAPAPTPHEVPFGKECNFCAQASDLIVWELGSEKFGTPELGTEELGAAGLGDGELVN